MHPYPIFPLKVFYTLLLCTFPFLLQAQIDLSKPVGTPLGAGGVSSTGGSTYTIPIKIPAGTNGMQPEINLAYNSQGGDGIAGWGWNLSSVSVITRAGKNNYYNGITTPVRYSNTNDAFVLDGQRMFLISGTNGESGAVYGLENEQFSKVQCMASSTQGPTWFQVTTKDGMTLDYGSISTATIPSDDGSGQTMLWFLNKVTDLSGNYVLFYYFVNPADRSYSLSEIQYSGNQVTGTTPYYRVIFNYNVRNEWSNTTTWSGGASLRDAFILTGVTVATVNGSQIIRTYSFTHDLIRGQYFLKTVTEKGSDGIGFNPLVFTYGANPSAPDMAVSLQYPNMHKGNVYAGDFDGDGRQDVLQSNYYFDNNNVPHYTSYDILSDFSSYNGQPAISFFYNYTISQNGATEVTGTSNAYYPFHTYDYDGDSKEDVLMLNWLTSGSDRLFNGVYINYSRRYSVYSGPTYYEESYPYIPHSFAYAQDFKYVYRNGTTFGSYFVPGDFDGDGAEDYILVLGINSSNAFKAFFSSPSKGIFNEEILQFGVEGTPSDPFYANSVASAKQLIPVDFDGDGKQELLVVKDNQSYILSVYPIPASSGYLFAAQVLYTVAGIRSKYPVFPGDFNGDGKTDLLYRAADQDVLAGWYIMYSTGKASHVQAFSFYKRPYLAVDNVGSAHHIMVADLNGDGKTDIWHSYDITTSSSEHNIYFSKGLSFALDVYSQAVSTNCSLQANTVVGDFNGDGKPDILSVDNNWYGRFIYPRPFKEERLLASATNGLGGQEGFEYALTIPGSGVYSRSGQYEYDDPGTPPGYSVNGNPYNVLSTPMFVVSQSYKPSGLGNGPRYTSFSYTDAAYHRVRGFLGFKQVSSTDGATGILSVTENDIDPNLLVSRSVHQYTSLYGEMLSDTKITDNLVKMSTSYSDKRYFRKILNTLTTNGLTGAATESNNTYDNYGNITENVTKTGGLNGTTVSPVEMVTTTTVYGTHNTPYPASPESITVQSLRVGQAPPATKTTTFGYNTTGLVTNKVTYAGLPKAITTTYAYDSYGNVTQSDVSAAGVSTRTQKFTYDNTGRLLTQKEILGSGISKKETITYNTITGNPATHVSEDGLTTSYQYDAFGRPTITTLPDGYNITQSTAWESSYGRYSISVERPGGGRNVKTWYDLLGREVRTEASGFNNNPLISSREFDFKGQEVNSVAPHYSNETAVTTTNWYDNYGRITETNNGTLINNYTYQKISGGQYQVTLTTNAGQTSTKIIDAAGRVVAAFDGGGGLNYTYNSRGKAAQISLNGIVINTSTYDDYGNQLSMTDKNAGTYNYQYDAFGQQVSQTNPAGQTVTSSYDPFGRIISRSGPEGATTWEYWKDAAAGYCNDNLVKVTGFGGEVREFTYNDLRRLQSDKTSFDGITYTMGFEYDPYGNPFKSTYSSGLTVFRGFDHDGTIVSATMVDGVSATPLFGASAMNGMGKYTSYSFGNGRQTTEIYDPVLRVLTQTTTPGVQSLGYTFDQQTGNLSSRKDLFSNVEEVFTYDNLNRLKTTTVNNVQQLAINYDGSTGNSLGNITYKSDAGNYVYNNQKINATAYITNPAGAQLPPPVISQQQQDITYTPFQKTSTITEGNYQVAYTYGSDYERIKSELKQNGATVETKYYFGGYERQTRNGVTREVHYIPAGNGIGAIIIKQNNAFQVYYVYTDYLASILTVTDASGNIIVSQNFDAWGRYRNPATWTYSNVPTAPEWLYRGFTGHEHLREFAMVNMNGRMYDPVTGRMMSADDYVSTPLNTQGYNRYGYGLNNPLTYTDPDGEFIQLIIGAIIGGVLNVVFNAGNIGNFWDGLKYFGVGAAAGALGAGVGAGVNAALAGGTFGAGFIGTSTTLATTSFFTGAAIGGAAGFSGGFVSGFGNGLLEGQNIGQALGSGLREGVIGGVAGGVVGGIAGGIDAATDGRRFFDGATVQDRVIVDQQLQYIPQNNEYNCGPACGESASRGQVTQDQLRLAIGGDPNAEGVRDLNLWQRWQGMTGRQVEMRQFGQVNLGDISTRMQDRFTVAISLRGTEGVGHGVLANRITERTITKISGRVIHQTLLHVMDPLHGQYIRLGTGALRNANLFFLAP